MVMFNALIRQYSSIHAYDMCDLDSVKLWYVGLPAGLQLKAATIRNSSDVMISQLHSLA